MYFSKLSSGTCERSLDEPLKILVLIQTDILKSCIKNNTKTNTNNTLENEYECIHLWKTAAELELNLFEQHHI